MIERDILIINVQVNYLIKETRINKAHRNVWNDWAARFCKKDIVTEIGNERRGLRKEWDT